MSKKIKNSTTGKDIAILDNNVIYNPITGKAMGIVEQSSLRSPVTGAEYGIVENSASGGCDHLEGIPGDGMCRVRFFDYEGTLLKTHYVPVGGAAVAPAIPEHERLVFQEWNNDFDNITRDKDVGAIYTTRSGASEFDIVLGINSGKTVTTSSCYIESEMVIDWGDGTTDTYSSVGYINPAHEYSDYGEYTVKFFCSKWYFGALTSFLSTGYYYDYYTVRRAFIAPGLTRNISFNNRGLEEFTVCSGSVYTTGIGNDYSLKAFIANRGLTNFTGGWSSAMRVVVLSDTVTSIGANALRAGRHCIEYIPDSVTSIGADCFRDSPHGFYSGKLYIPEGVTVINERTFQAVEPLREVVLASLNLREIKANAFNSCRKLADLRLYAETPPTLDSTAFDNTNLSCIHVPAGSGAAYKAATNWSALADIIKETE